MSIGKRLRFEPNCPPGGSQRRQVLDPVLWRLGAASKNASRTHVKQVSLSGNRNGGCGTRVCARRSGRGLRPVRDPGPAASSCRPGCRPLGRGRREAARRRETRVPVPTRAPAAAVTVLPTPTCREAVSGCFLLTPALGARGAPGAHTRAQQVGRSRACNTRSPLFRDEWGACKRTVAFRRATRAASHRLPRDADKSHHTETAAPRGACGGPGVGLNAAEGHHGSPSPGSPQVAAAERRAAAGCERPSTRRRAPG